MSGCGECGPISTQINGLRQTADLLIQGHGFLAISFKELASKMTDPKDQADLLAVAKFHEDVAAATAANIPTFTEE